MVRGLAATLLVPVTSGCAGGVLDPQGPVGRAEKLILINSLGIMLAVIVPTIVATLVFAWWFRAGNKRAVYRPEWIFSGQVELVVWAIPAMVVILLGGIAWVGSHDLDPYRPLIAKVAPIEIEVVALDWKWLFIYPGQGIASVNRLVVPAGTPIAFRLTSASVMNSFFVPQLGGQIYAMAGMATRLHLQADRPGRYHGLSTQFSGEGFADMHFTVDAMTPAAFAGWVAATKGRGGTLDAASYTALARPSAAVGVASYGSVSPGLFDTVVRLTTHPMVAPVAARAGAAQ